MPQVHALISLGTCPPGGWGPRRYESRLVLLTSPKPAQGGTSPGEHQAGERSCSRALGRGLPPDAGRSLCHSHPRSHPGPRPRNRGRVSVTGRPPPAALLGREPAHGPAPGPCPVCSRRWPTSPVSDPGREGEPCPVQPCRQVPAPARPRVSTARWGRAGRAS